VNRTPPSSSSSFPLLLLFPFRRNDVSSDGLIEARAFPPLAVARPPQLVDGSRRRCFPTSARHRLCRAEREREREREGASRLLAQTQGEKKCERGAVDVILRFFVAATLCYRVVAAWRRSSLLFLSLSPPSSPAQSLALCLIRTACAPPPPSHRLVTVRILISWTCCGRN